MEGMVCHHTWVWTMRQRIRGPLQIVPSLSKQMIVESNLWKWLRVKPQIKEPPSA